MKLHWLTLTNYRGITHRRIDFPDSGVIVVCGANEIGKTSMVEALDLLLEHKDRSTKKEVKQVKPTHADVGAEVSAEISTGGYRFVYSKRFHKKCETRLELLSPRREQLTGDEAHDRVRAMLAQTVDVELWQAQRVMQAGSTAPVDLSGCDVLSRALDVAAGEAAQLSGAEPLLVDRIDAEYAQFFTPTGRPTGQWSAATARLKAADEEVARCAAAVAEVDDAVRRHAVVSDRLVELSEPRKVAAARLTTAKAAADVVAELTDSLRHATVEAGAARTAHAAAVSALTERRQLRADADTRAETVDGLVGKVAAAEDAEVLAREVHEAAVAAVGESETALQAAEARVDAARAMVGRLSDRDESDKLANRLARIAATERERADVCAELAPIRITDASMRDIEKAAAAVDRATVQVESTAVRIEFTALADVLVRVAGEDVALGDGKDWSVAVTGPTEIEVPGVLRAGIHPGAPATDMAAKLAAAQQILESLLQAAAVPDLAAAQAMHERGRELAGRRDRLTATLTGLCGDDTVQQLEARLAVLRGRAPAEPDLWDAALDKDSVAAQLEQADAERRAASTKCETQRKVVAAAWAKLAEKTTAATVLKDRLAAARRELEQIRTRIAAQREARSDDELAVSVQAHGETARTADVKVDELTTALAAAGPDSVAAELAEAQHAITDLDREHGGLTEELRDLAAALKVFGTQGRRGVLDAAQTEHEHAKGDFLRMRRRARAAQLLRTVMARHRDSSRQRYVDPFRAELERLGRLVFGDGFEVEVDSDLRIRSRTLAGRTVPYESLSGGAKEQLGIVARLAAAVLVAKEDSVPVVIDDALGFTDPDRLARMGAVFDAVGGDSQVIVLTCSPQRFTHVSGAHHIELSA